MSQDAKAGWWLLFLLILAAWFICGCQTAPVRPPIPPAPWELHPHASSGNGDGADNLPPVPRITLVQTNSLIASYQFIPMPLANAGCTFYDLQGRDRGSSSACAWLANFNFRTETGHTYRVKYRALNGQVWNYVSPIIPGTGEIVGFMTGSPPADAALFTVEPSP